MIYLSLFFRRNWQRILGVIVALKFGACPFEKALDYDSSLCALWSIYLKLVIAFPCFFFMRF